MKNPTGAGKKPALRVKYEKNAVPLIGCLFSILILAPVARAQVGSGWTPASYTERFEYESNDILLTISPPPSYFNNGYCEYSRTNGVEIFQLLSSHSNRAETRPNDDYSSGSRQFQADVLVVTNTTTGECIHQVFNGSTGPYLLLRQNYLTSSNYTISVGGTLPSGDTSGVVVTNLYGAWFQLNSINSLVDGQTYVYINGVLVWQGANPGGTFYTKYGVYGTHSDANPADIVFTNAMLFSGGTAVRQDFRLSATPSSQSVMPGSNATYTVTSTFTNTVNNLVYFSVTGLPMGAAANFNPTSVVGTGSSTLTVSTAGSTPVGAYTLAIVGATTGSSDISHTNTVTLNVTGFSISTSPASDIVPTGRTASYTTTVTPGNGFNGTVSLNASGLPGGTSASFNPASISSSGSSTLTVTISNTAAAGSYNFNVIGSSSGTSETNAVALIVIPQPHITNLNLSGTALTLSGTNGTAGVTYYLLSSTNVALSLSQWIPLLTNTFSGGSFSITNPVNPVSPQQYYILQVQ